MFNNFSFSTLFTQTDMLILLFFNIKLGSYAFFFGLHVFIEPKFLLVDDEHYYSNDA